MNTELPGATAPPHHGSIVVGVHETVFSGQALRWAAEQAQVEGRPVLLAHAAEGSLVSRYAGAMAAGETVLLRAAEVVRRAAPDLDVRRLLRPSPATTLLTELSTDAWMVVLGSRGRGPTLSHLLGSVGQGVVRRAACPVVVHRPGNPGLVRDGVVAAVRATGDAEPVLEVAFRLASQRGLPLRVLHVVWDPGSAMVGASVGDLTQEQASDELAVGEALAGFGERYPDVHTTVAVTPGLPERDIALAAHRADLLVVGTSRLEAWSRLLVGSVAVSALERATCPVVVVPVG
ncbi:universal stress protein [Nocardioides islandensis]|jgi:nucleotide-binding universal stress UspA family protein|uniref:Universal stress protein n=1 Tax=Nocardioides islandensis TaxID=433663 RepID=A0A930YKH2_9ACTN|nr:universal stress protein [Nocardioides islandensis]MBF4766049.1 universal stress protein [Nocardioides islandensis]